MQHIRAGGCVVDQTLTQKTVESHVRSILRKLDLPADAAHNRRVHAVLAFLRHDHANDHQPQPP